MDLPSFLPQVDFLSIDQMIFVISFTTMIVQVIKKVDILVARFFPLVSMVIALFTTMAMVQEWTNPMVYLIGLGLGLSASGTFDVFKKTLKS